VAAPFAMRQIPTETDSELAEFGFESKGLVISRDDTTGPCGGVRTTQVVCGMNGCLNVRKSCRLQMVGACNGQVAVVTCDR
jgi:hypothetical protein